MIDFVLHKTSRDHLIVNVFHPDAEGIIKCPEWMDIRCYKGDPAYQLNHGEIITI